MKTRVLVFPCGSEIGLEVFKSANFSSHFQLIGGSSTEDHGQFVYQDYIGDLPMVESPNFISELNDLVERRKVDLIIPAHDSVVLKVAQAATAGKLKCKAVTSPVETCEIARSKLKTYETLRNTVPVPKIYSRLHDINSNDLPLFLKPDVGQGTKGTFLAKTKEELRLYSERDPSLLWLEYLPGKEYTVDCFTDRHGNVRFGQGRERIRVMNGISVRTARTKDGRFGELASKINQRLRFRGVWFFQVKENTGGELVLMEVASRVAGAMGLVRCQGVNLVLLSLFDALGYDVDIFQNGYDLIMDRALENRYKSDLVYKHVYIDLDDLVVFENKVNPTAIAFVYQCLGMGIQTHLLTKHKEDLEATLKRYRLHGIFDEVIWVREGEKYLHIKEKDAIFIDDSFAERRAVRDKLGLPVFDSHMLECLMVGL